MKITLPSKLLTENDEIPSILCCLFNRMLYCLLLIYLICGLFYEISNVSQNLEFIDIKEDVCLKAEFCYNLESTK